MRTTTTKAAGLLGTIKRTTSSKGFKIAQPIGWLIAFVAGAVLAPFSNPVQHCNDQGVSFASYGISNTKQEGRKTGWNGIDVFYGSTDYAVSLLWPGQQWFSQANQDQIILSMFKNKRQGYFIDLASNDAINDSNTYVLERDYGWRGVCIEPNPKYWYRLSHYREYCHIVGAVVGHKTMEQVSFQYDGGTNAEMYRQSDEGVFGGIVGDQFENKKVNDWEKRSVKEYTTSLLDIFRRYNVPNVIDYLSLDVEGAEGFIMSAFPAKEYKIKVMTVERPKEDLQKLLYKYGYQYLDTISSFGETLWAHQDYLSELDRSNLPKFHKDSNSVHIIPNHKKSWKPI